MNVAVSIEENIGRFTMLSSELKMQKVMVMLKQIISVHTIFSDIYQKLSTKKVIYDKTLVVIYTGILQVADQIHMNNKQYAGKNLQESQKILDALYEQEEKEKIGEGDVEDMLSYI